MELVGRIVASFYNICIKTWRRSQETESLKSGIENTSGVIKAGENHQPEELLTARSGFAHDDNEGENFDDEKHCKTLSEVSINSNEKETQKKVKRKTTLYISRDQKRLANKWKKC